MLSEIELKKIKLIIWDLDDTLWHGTISEGEIQFPDENKKLIIELSKRGVVNSICSKNKQDVVEKILIENDLYEYFVFNSINWEAKGPRIKNIVESMALRQENVLFIDDNEHNLGEAKHYCPALMIESPEVIFTLINNINIIGKSDLNLSRLLQYKVLEKKSLSRMEYGDEIAFLRDSKIQVYIGEDCVENIDRIYELVHRSNQLNYTKVRCSKDELLSCLKNCDVEAKYICASDKYGDYGLIGFYALNKKENILIHYLFSCRTLGMHIEQYIYQNLGFPNIIVSGEVTVELKNESDITYITQTKKYNKVNNKKQKSSKQNIVFRGPCDLDSVIAYLDNKKICKEFRYVNKDGNLVSNGSHPAILENIIKQRFGDRTKLFDPDVYHTNIFNGRNKLIVLSTLLCPHLGEYRCIENDERIIFGEWKYNAADTEEQNKFIEGVAWCGYNTLTKADYIEFSRTHEYIGRIPPAEMAYRYIDIISKIPKNTKVCLILGSEKEFSGEKYESLKLANIYFKEFNKKIQEYLMDYDNVDFINVTKFIEGINSYRDSINHYSRDVYYKMALELSVLYPSLFKCRRFTVKSLILFIKFSTHKILDALFSNKRESTLKKGMYGKK